MCVSPPAPEVGPPTYLTTFKTPERARNYVRRLVRELKQIAIWIPPDAIPPRVIVYDGGDRDQGERILQLARESDAEHVAIKP